LPELVEIRFPQMGVSVTEGTLGAWLKAEGDEVKAEEPVCEIVTDKVDAEVPAPADGVLKRILVGEGETVPVGSVLAELAVGKDAGSALPKETTRLRAAAGERSRSMQRVGTDATVDPANAAAPQTPVELTPPTAPSSTAQRFDPLAAAEDVVTRGPRNGRPRASPVARRLAEANRLDLRSVRGTGRAGRIGKQDVLDTLADSEQADQATVPAAAARALTAPSAAVEQSESVPRGYEDVPHRLVPHSPQRRAIAEHMVRSRLTAPHVTTHVSADMEAVARARSTLNARRREEGREKLSVLPFIARAACLALRDHPDLNATYREDSILQWTEVHLGIAVDTPRGLVVPVIRGAHRLSVEALAEAMADLANRSRSRRLTPEDMRAGTFTITNPGSLGAHAAAAIINQPQVAILGTPAMVRRPWVVTTPDGDEGIAIRSVMDLTLSFDHRAVDGAEATRFLVALSRIVENWSGAVA
jgi:pyruvate dehydrogenase E2 component (dihydrolipoamide acetyltransferase)